MSGIFLHGEVSDASEVLARAKEKSFVLLFSLFFQKPPQKNTYNFVNEPPETPSPHMGALHFGFPAPHPSFCLMKHVILCVII